MEDLRLDIDAPNEKTKRIGAVALENKAPGESQINPDLKTRAIMFLNKYGKMLAFFAAKAGNRKLNFAPSLNDDGFAFDASACKVVAPISWFADERYNDHELLFANFHEIGHFLDMRTNPNAYLENFDYMEKKSESLAKDYAAKHSNALPYEKMKKKYYKELHDLYNVLDDIYVNNLVFQCNKFFDSGDGREDVETLYEKLGFSDADLTDLPLHRQFIMSLLRDEMLGKTHGESVVDERVSSVLSRPL